MALDFRCTCFLPPSFFAVAMAKAFDDFTYPKSDDVGATVSASYYLVPFGRNDIGQPDSFSFYYLDQLHDWTGIPRNLRKSKGL